MKRLINTALLPSLFLSGCALRAPAAGDWELEVEDADMCEIEMELEQDGEDVFGDADVNCRIFFNYGGEVYYYDLEARGADVEGEFDFNDSEITLEISFYDNYLEDTIELEIEGEIEEDEFDGELWINGDRFGDIQGDIEA